MVDFTTFCPACAKSWVITVDKSPTPGFCPHCARVVNWYFVRQGLRTGSVYWDRLRAIVRSGKLLPNDLILPEGGQHGQEARVLFPELVSQNRPVATPPSNRSLQTPPTREPMSQSQQITPPTGRSSTGTKAVGTIGSGVFLVLLVILAFGRASQKHVPPQLIPASLDPAKAYTPPASFQANHAFAAQVRDYEKEPDKFKRPAWSEMNQQAYRAVLIATDPAERARHLIHSQSHAILLTAHPTCTLIGVSELQKEPLDGSDGITLHFRFDYQSRLNQKRFYMKAAFGFDAGGQFQSLLVTEDSADVAAFLAANFIVGLVKAEISYLTANALPSSRTGPKESAQRKQAVDMVARMVYEVSEPIDAKLLLEWWLKAHQ
jgi:hypothetical protein